jgi:hypothetical protein
MSVLLKSNIATTDPCIAQMATTPFRWCWDSNHWALWMFHYPWRPLGLTHSLLHQKLTNPPDSLSGSNTFSNRFSLFYRSLMPSTRNAMINTGCQISFRWATKFGFTCKKNVLQGPIKRLSHSSMGHTTSPRMWVTMILCSTFPLSLACTQSSMWIFVSHISHPYWTPQR